jgi:hypothetical protein
MKINTQRTKEVPRVLIQACESAKKSQITCMHTNGPWDKGHWANRK